MANNYSNNWTQSRATLDRSNLHLEREYDFSSLSANSSSQPQRQAGFQDMYASSSYQISPNGITSQSSLSSAFLPDQSQPGRRVPSFGSHEAAMQTSSNSMVTSNTNVYASGQNQSQIQATYSASLRNQAGNRQTWNTSASFNFQNPLPGSSQYPSTDSNATAAGPYLSASPGPMQETFSAKASYYPPRALQSDSRAKRPYTQLQDDQRDEDQDHDITPDPKESNKGKSGACARCKSLKVKCEFKTDTDPCKRCMNGGHDCVIPGRKKRRAPPKREHLMNQIREQAAQIKELMTQLEKLNASGLSNHRSSSVTSDAPTSSPTLQSPVLSPSATSDSLFESDTPLPSNSPKMSPEANKAIEDWIAKARETFQELDGFIGMGGAGMPKSYLVKEDLENPENSDDEFVEVPPSDDDEEYEFDIEHDGDEPNAGRTAPLRHASSASSLGTDTAAQLRKRSSGESSKPAILPGGAAPFGLFGDLSLKTSRRKGTGSEAENEADKAPGIANTNFFRSTPAPESVDNRLASFPQQAPYILTRGIITPQEAERLFHIYFEEMNLSLSLLDPVLYTAQRTCYRSPFLFTVICAIASRFYEEKPGLYPQLMHYAQLAAGTALIGGPKNVEMCSAYLLLSLYPIPAKRWEDQRSWLYLGLAIRTATDLNLHLPNTAKPLNENHAREMLNRTRVWLNLFNVDRSTSSQYGRKPIIPNSDYMANHSENWWCSSPYNMKNFDIQLCAYNSDAIIMSEFLAKIYSDPHHPTGLNKEVDFERIATETDDRLKQTGDRWFAILEKTDMSDPQNSFRTGLLRLAYPYARLVALSYGFQHAFGKNNTDENPFLTRCLSAATDVLDAVVNNICRPSQRHYWRHGPEAQSVFITFASAFLVKLLQPKFASYLSMEKRMEIRERVQRVVDLLSSPEIAIDDRHGPKLYAKFLKGLLASPLARVDTSPVTSARRTRVAKSPSGGQPPEVNSNIPATTAASPHHHDITPNTSNHPSPAHSGSLSPPPRKMAMSFDSFAPSGATDPFIPDLGLSSTVNLSENSNVDMTYFSSFDDSILQSMQTVSDPSGWQDTMFPAGFNWMAEFERDVNMSYSTQPATTLFSDSIQYMTGV